MISEIRHYCTGQDGKEYIQRIIAGMRAVDLVEKCVSELDKMTDREEIGNAIDFISDVYIARDAMVSRRYASNFRNALDSAGRFRKCLGRFIVTPQRTVDSRIMGFFRYLNDTYSPILHKAYEQAKETDPFSIPHVVSELNWITKSFHWDIVKGLSKSSDYLNRWSVLGLLEKSDCPAEDSEFGRKFLSIYDRLRKDPIVLVAQEAVYLYVRLKFNLAYYENLPKRKDRRKSYSAKHRPCRKILNDLGHPCVSFNNLKITYGNLLHAYTDLVSSKELIERFISIEWRYPASSDDYYSRLYSDLTKGQ